MTTKSSIFDQFPDASDDESVRETPPASKASPFRIAEDPSPSNASSAEEVAESKPKVLSPFMVIDHVDEAPPTKPRPAKIPEKRKPRSPFQIAEEGGPMAMMPAAQGFPASSPFQAAYPSAAMPYPPMPLDPSYGAYPGYPPAYAANLHGYGLPMDPLASRQLELRAIFGVDRPMSMEEILEHCRKLPGVRDLTFLSGREASAIDALQSVFQRIGHAGAPLRLHAGDASLELVREGPIVLVIVPDGEFKAGVRETLTIVAREIARIM